MKHRIGYNRIGRKSSHRKALVKNMVTQLYRYERIKTTKAKALEVRRRAEKLITRAREDTVHNRRIVAKLIQDKEILAKLFTEIAPAYVDRPGGYTRILKLGYRKGDAAEMVLLELVGNDEEPTPRRRRGRSSSTTAKEPEAAAKTTDTAKDETEEVAAAPEATAEIHGDEEITAGSVDTTESDSDTGAEEPASEESTSAGAESGSEETPEKAGENEKS